MSHLWKKVQYEILDEKNIYRPSQIYQDSRHLLQNPKVPRSVMGFSNRLHRFTESNYLVVDSPLGHFSLDQFFFVKSTKKISLTLLK